MSSHDLPHPPFMDEAMSRKSLVSALCAIGAVAIMTGFALPGQPDGANVYNDFGCSIAGSPIGAPDMFSTNTHAVVTRSGNTQFKCTAEIAAGFEPSSAVRIVGLGCSTQGGFAPESVNIYTPGGKAHLICNINRGK